MTSIVSICNMALANIGKTSISALSDAGAEALACNQFYEIVKDGLLQSFPWRFADKTQAMAQLTNDRSGEWLYAYSKPNDCLKIHFVRQEFSAISIIQQTSQQQLENAYAISGEKIYCNISPAFLVYTRSMTDTTKFPPLFVDAIAQSLSVRLAMPLTRDPKVRADQYQLAKIVVEEAKVSDANDSRNTSDHDSDLIGARS